MGVVSVFETDDLTKEVWDFLSTDHQRRFYNHFLNIVYKRVALLLDRKTELFKSSQLAKPVQLDMGDLLMEHADKACREMLTFLRAHKTLGGRWDMLLQDDQTRLFNTIRAPVIAGFDLILAAEAKVLGMLGRAPEAPPKVAGSPSKILIPGKDV